MKRNSAKPNKIIDKDFFFRSAIVSSTSWNISSKFLYRKRRTIQGMIVSSAPRTKETDPEVSSSYLNFQVVATDTVILLDLLPSRYLAGELDSTILHVLYLHNDFKLRNFRLE